MATSIPAGAPLPPQNRVQRMDEHGNFHPVPEVPQPQKEPSPPSAPAYAIGDQVMLSGRVLEVQSPQGGQTSVKVQLDHSGGAVWLRGEHLAPGPDARDRQIEQLETRVSEQDEQAKKDGARIKELEAAATAKPAAPQSK